MSGFDDIFKVSEMEVDPLVFNELKIEASEYFKPGTGHGVDHVVRVYNMALKISETEDVDMDVVKASCLLHDIARDKEESDSEICHAEEGAKMAEEILKEKNFPQHKIEMIIHAIRVHRYSKRLKATSREAEILQDADRLDALGAIIVSRVFELCGKRGLPIYEPKVPAKESYDGTKTNGINHLKEKCLKITPESFNTPIAREIAEGRYKYIEDFIQRFEKEWIGEL